MIVQRTPGVNSRINPEPGCFSYNTKPFLVCLANLKFTEAEGSFEYHELEGSTLPCFGVVRYQKKNERTWSVNPGERLSVATSGAGRRAPDD